jgi:hypothetical protein
MSGVSSMGERKMNAFRKFSAVLELRHADRKSA